MAKQDINLGTAPSGLDGDDARTAFAKVNANFGELYGGSNASPAKLTAIANAVWAANQMAYMSGPSTVAMTPLTAFARTILDDADAAAVRTTISALTAGDYGVGGNAILAPTVLGTITATGFYYCGASVTDGPITTGTGAAQGYIIHIKHPTSGYAWQLFRSVSTPRTFERYQVGGTWGTWQEHLNVGDLGGLGTTAMTTNITDFLSNSNVTGPIRGAMSSVANGPSVLNEGFCGWCTKYTDAVAFYHVMTGTSKAWFGYKQSATTISWIQLQDAADVVTLNTSQEIPAQKTFTGAQIRHRSPTPGLWMSPSNDTSYDDIWMVMSGNVLQWQRRANGFTSTLRTTPLLIEMTNNHIVAGTGYVLRSAGDNVASLGTSSQRWSVVYAGTGTINTSDAREKTPVSALEANQIAAAIALSKEIGTYKWLASIQEKGEDARLHIGMTVQRAVEIMEANGLDPMAYGFICYDSWDATPENSYMEQRGYLYTLNEETEEEQVVVENVIEEGNAFPDTGVYWKYTHDEKVVISEAVPAGDRYSFRYDELNLFIAAGIEARLAALEEAMG